MSPKRKILQALRDQNAVSGEPGSVRPSAIPGFTDSPEKYQQTINALLKDRLIEGMKDPDGHRAISINSHRERDIQRVLRPLWAHPGLIAAATLSAAALAAILLM